jgi:hypothetical protein
MQKAIAGVTVLGWCSACKQFVELPFRYSSLPSHETKKGKSCPNAGYSCGELKYRVESAEQAKLLAQVIINDTTKCLSGQDMHTLGCADGNSCAEERSRRAKALAQYFLDNP